MRILIALFLLGTLAACGSTSNTSRVEPVNVMIMVDDGSADALPRGHQGVRRLVNAVADGLNDAGVNVYDESATTLDDFGGSSLRRDKAMLIDIARSQRKADLDFVVLLTAEAVVRDRDHGKVISSRVYGQTIAVDSGKVAGNLNSSGARQNAPKSCSRLCVNDKIAESVLRTEGDIIAGVLSDLPVSYSRKVEPVKQFQPRIKDYVLVFEGFSQSEMNDVDEYLVIFSGYDDMRITDSEYRYTEIWYESSIAEAKLQRNLNRMLREMSVNATVSAKRNEFVIEKSASRPRNSEKFDLHGWEE